MWQIDIKVYLCMQNTVTGESSGDGHMRTQKT